MPGTVSESTVERAPGRLKERVLRAGGWVTAGFVLEKAVAAGQIVVLMRLLTPADFGLMAASAAILLALLTLVEMGVEPALVVRQDIRDEDLAVAWTLSVIRAIVLALCLWMFAEAVAHAMRMPELASLLRVHAAALLIQGVQSPALAKLLRELDLRRRVQLDLTRRIAEAVATIGLAIWLRNVWALLLGQLIGFAVTSLLSYRLAPFAPHWSFNRDALAHFWRYGRHVNMATILIFLVMNGGELVIGRLLGAKTLGLYQLAMAIPSLIGIRTALMMSQVSFPTYAAIQQDRAGVARAFAIQIRVMGLMLIPIAASLAVTAPVLVPFVFGVKWEEAIAPIQVLSMYAVCAGLSGVMAPLHYGLNRPDVQVRIWVVMCAVYAGALLPLIDWAGLVGAASALALSYGLGLGLHIAATVKLLGVDARPVFARLGRITAPVLVAAGAWALAHWHGVETVTRAVFVWATVACAAVYAVRLWYREYRRLVELWKGE